MAGRIVQRRAFGTQSQQEGATVSSAHTSTATQETDPQSRGELRNEDPERVRRGGKYVSSEVGRYVSCGHFLSCGVQRVGAPT